MEAMETGWDAGVVWDGEPEEWEIPAEYGMLSPTREQGRRLGVLGEGEAPEAPPEGRVRVVAVSPEWSSAWFVTPLEGGNMVDFLLAEEAEDVDSEGRVTYRVRFGTAPAGWLERLGEFDGW